MITWTRPSGVDIETNDKKETITFAESLGWKRKVKVEKIVKRVRRSKEQIEADNAKEG